MIKIPTGAVATHRVLPVGTKTTLCALIYVIGTSVALWLDIIISPFYTRGN